MRLSILRKGSLLLAIPLATDLLCLGLIAHQQEAQFEAQTWHLHSKDVEEKVYTLMQTATEAQIGVAAELLIGGLPKPVLLDEAHRAVTERLEGLRESIRDNPLQTQNAAVLTASVEGLFGALESVRSLAGHADTTIEQKRDVLAVARRHITDAQTRAAAFLAEEERLETLRGEDADAQRRMTMGTVLVAAGLTVVVSILMLLAFTRGISRRLSAAARGAETVGRGERLPALGRQADDEIGDLAVALTTMAATLDRTRQIERDYRGELERRVEIRTRELASANTELSRSNRELQEFAAVCSHDLQEPLRKVQAFGDRLVIECAPQLSSEGREYIERMRAAVARMQGLINDLLCYARVTSSAQPLETIALDAVLRDVVSDLEQRLADTKGTVDVAALPRIQAEPTQIHQVFQNLIGNALKFHRDGVAPHVRVFAELGDGARPHRIIVEDNGIGFDEKYLDRIFGVFQRLHGRGKYEGSGIGLALVKKIVDRHGGSVTATSTVGVGSRFVVAWPVVPSHGETSA